MFLLWAQEGGYWKIVAIRLEDSNDAGIVPKNAAAQAAPSVEEPQNIGGEPAAVKNITEFYQTWIMKRNVIQASAFASQRSYQCLAAPSADQKKLTPIARVQYGLKQPLAKLPSAGNLSDMMRAWSPSMICCARYSRRTPGPSR